MHKRWFVVVASVMALCTLFAVFVSSNGTARALATPATSTITLAPDFTGTATFAEASGKTTVTISIAGLPANSSHAAHIHVGTSCASNGAVVYPLTDVVADATGKGTSTTLVNVALSAFADANHYVNVHDLSSAGGVGRSIVCGEVASGATSAALVGASGKAVITDTGNGTTSVNLTVIGLQPSTSHATHIHVGTCEAQGAVVYPLTTLTADASGMATSSTSVAAPYSAIADGNHYVNVHVRGPNDNPAVGYGITCGDIAAAAVPPTAVPATATALPPAPTPTPSVPGLPNTGTAPAATATTSSPMPLFALALAFVVAGCVGAMFVARRTRRA